MGAANLTKAQERAHIARGGESSIESYDAEREERWTAQDEAESNERTILSALPVHVPGAKVAIPARITVRQAVQSGRDGTRRAAAEAKKAAAKKK